MQPRVALTTAGQSNATSATHFMTKDVQTFLTTEHIHSNLVTTMLQCAGRLSRKVSIVITDGTLSGHCWYQAFKGVFLFWKKAQFLELH